jgi:hypothetical protein
MKRFLVVLFCLMVAGVVYAIQPIKAGDGEVTPFVDAQISYQYWWGGLYDFPPQWTRDPLVEAGLRYDVSDKNWKYNANISLIDPYMKNGLVTGQLNFNALYNNTHHFMVGRGTFPFGVTIRNHQFNNRIEDWAPTTLSIFGYNCVGEYNEGMFYEYMKEKYRFKVGLMQDTPYILYGDTYKQNEIQLPVVSLQLMPNKVIETELTYANFKNYEITYIGGLAFNLPKNWRIEYEYILHKRTECGFDLFAQPDKDISRYLGFPPGFGAQIDNLKYESNSICLIKTFYTKKNKPFSLYGQIFYQDSRADFMVTKDNVLQFPVPSRSPFWGNSSIRGGMHYELNENLMWSTEYEHNTIDVLPHWKHRVSTCLRLKL